MIDEPNTVFPTNDQTLTKFASTILGLLSPKGPWYEVTIESCRESFTSAFLRLNLRQRPRRHFEHVALLPEIFTTDATADDLARVFARAASELGSFADPKGDWPALRALRVLAAQYGSTSAAMALCEWAVRTYYYDKDPVGFFALGKIIIPHITGDVPLAKLGVDLQLRAAIFSENTKLMIEVRNRARGPIYDQFPEFLCLQDRLRKLPAVPGTLTVFREIAPEPANREIDLSAFLELQYKPLSLVASRDPTTAIAPLRTEFPWFAPVLDRIERQLELCAFADGSIRLRPLLLHGAPGIGKNRFVRRLAEILSLPVMNFNAGGSADSMGLKGAARGWATSRPSLVAQAVAQHGCANPLIFVDELDKEGVSRHNGRVSDVLHQLLEKESSRAWLDECLLGQCDFSRVNWIAAANSIQHMGQPLLSRFDVVRVPAPTREHYPGIFRGIVADIVGDYGVDPAQVLGRFTNPEIRYLCERSQSPRHLRRLVEAILANKLRELRRLVH